MTEDLISRQKAIDALDEIEAEVADGYGYQYAKWREYFAELPPAQPERIRAKWILADEQCIEDTCNGNYLYNCSNCGYGDTHSKAISVPYCWHCGADMKGERDD